MGQVWHCVSTSTGQTVLLTVSIHDSGQSPLLALTVSSQRIPSFPHKSIMDPPNFNSIRHAHSIDRESLLAPAPLNRSCCGLGISSNEGQSNESTLCTHSPTSLPVVCLKGCVVINCLSDVVPMLRLNHRKNPGR